MKSVRIAAVLAVLSLVVFSIGCEKPQKEEPQAPPPVAEKLPPLPRDAIPDNSTPPPAVSSEPPPTERPITTIAPEPSGGHKAAKTTTPKPKEKYASGKKDGGKTYVVQKGDTLQEISQKFYGTTTKWKKIANANKGAIKDPNKLVVGTKIQIP
jgi:nucleoid-associated protein YgaU